MKKFNLISTLFIAIACLTIACKKDKGTDESAVQSAKDFTAKFGAQQQNLQINASALPQTVTLAGGTKINFPAGSLTKGGVAVTGMVTVEAIEVLKRSTVLFTGANTNHVSGAPLASDGFIFLDVKANGSSVDQNLAVPVKIAIPAKREGSTQLWIGVDQNDKPLVAAGNNQMAWQAPRPQANGAGQKEVNAANSAFTFDFGALGWINCDVFYSYANPKTTITVEVNNNPGAMANFHAYSGETYVFFCPKGSNVAAQLYTPAGANRVKSYDNTMPVGVQGRMLSFSIKDGRFYYAAQEITISAGQNIALSLSETTEAAVQNAINSLDSY